MKITSTRGPFVLLEFHEFRLTPRLSFDSGKEKHCAGHRHGSASQLQEVDQTSGAEYLDFACCYAGLLGVFRRYNGSPFCPCFGTGGLCRARGGFYKVGAFALLAVSSFSACLGSRVLLRRPIQAVHKTDEVLSFTERCLLSFCDIGKWRCDQRETFDRIFWLLVATAPNISLRKSTDRKAQISPLN